MAALTDITVNLPRENYTKMERASAACSVCVNTTKQRERKKERGERGTAPLGISEPEPGCGKYEMPIRQERGNWEKTAGRSS